MPNNYRRAEFLEEVRYYNIRSNRIIIHDDGVQRSSQLHNLKSHIISCIPDHLLHAPTCPPPKRNPSLTPTSIISTCWCELPSGGSPPCNWLLCAGCASGPAAVELEMSEEAIIIIINHQLYILSRQYDNCMYVATPSPSDASSFEVLWFFITTSIPEWLKLQSLNETK